MPTQESNVIPHSGTPGEDSPHSPEANLSIAEVAAQSQALDEQWGQHQNALFSGPNDEFRDLDQNTNPIELAIAEVEAELGDSAGVQHLYSGLRQRLATTLSPEQFSASATHIDEILRIETETRRLQGEYGEAMHAHHDAALRHLLSSTNWDRMIELLASNDWPEQATLDKDTVLDRLAFDVVSSPPPAELHIAYLETQRIEELAECARNVGAEHETPLSEPENGWFVQGDAISGVRSWEDLTDKAMAYLSGFRSVDALDLRQAMPTEAFIRLGQRLRLSGSATENVPTPILAAYERFTANLLQNFDTQEAGQSYRHVQERPNALYVGLAHRQELAETAGITDVPAWVQQRLDRFGPRLGGGIGFIEFTTQDSPNHSHDTDTKGKDEMVTVGERIEYANKLHIDIHQTLKQRLKEKHPGIDPALASRMIRDSIEETLDHEVAHHIHSAILTVSELREWQEALEAEPDLSINKYIQKLAAEQVPETRLLREQFATTLELFMNEPLRVARNYPQRFAVLNRFTKRYDPDKIASTVATIRTMEANGEHREAARYIQTIEQAHRK